jgi:hypothetical protein
VSTIWFRRAADYLWLERNVVVVLAVIFLPGFGEELWKRYLPKYLEALGDYVGIVGLFGITKNFSARFTSTLAAGSAVRCRS